MGTVVRKAPPHSALLRIVLFVLTGCSVAMFLGLALMPSPTRLYADPPTPTYIPPDCRIGFAGVGFVPGEPTLRAFRSGMYYGYAYPINTLGPSGQYLGGMRRIELLRVHNLMATADPRTPGAYTGYYYGVPYIQPTGGTVAWEFLFAAANARATSTDVAAIAAVASQNPGTLWLVGNEIDHPDKGFPPGTLLPTMTPSSAPATSAAVRQDGILPAAYAQAYATIYPLIKTADPSAQIAPGSVVVWSPMREGYYDQVLDAYRELSGGTPMPIDWFNIHTYVMSEQYSYPTCHYDNCRGPNAGFPPGYPTPNLTATTATPTPGYSPTPTNTPMGAPLSFAQTQLTSSFVKDQIIAVRIWMKEHHYQDKPLIVSEYKTLVQRYALSYCDRYLSRRPSDSDADSHTTSHCGGISPGRSVAMAPDAHGPRDWLSIRWFSFGPGVDVLRPKS